MVNSNGSTKSLGSPGAGTSAANAGAGGNPGGGNAGGGGTSAGASVPGVIPAKVKTNSLRNEVTQLASGIGTQFPSPSSTLPVKGQSMTRDQLLGALAALAGLFTAVDNARQELKSQLLALQAATPGAREQIADIKAALVAFFGRGNPVLEHFGIQPRKARKLTGQQMTVKQAKANATRSKRGTLGPRVKKSVKFEGQVAVQTKLSGTAAPAAGAGPSTAGAPAGASAGNGTGTPNAGG